MEVRAIPSPPPPGDGPPRSPGGLVPGGWPFLLLALALVGVGLSFWRPVPVGVWHDDGVYMLIGKALAGGEGLRYAGVPGAPPAVKFPPLYPGVLAALWAVLGSVGPATLAAELLNLLLVAAAGGLVAWALYRGAGLGRGHAAAVAALAFVSADVWRPALVPLSEPLFMLLAAAAVAAWPGASRPGDRRGTAVVAALLVLAVLTRSAALALVVGFGLALVVARGWTVALVACAPALAAAGAWGAWASRHAPEIPAGLRDVLGPYGGWLAGQLLAAPGSFVRALPAHALALAERVAALLVPGLAGWGLWAAALPLAGAGAVGLVRLGRRFPPLAWIPVAYVGMLLLWPYVDRRLVAPLHPWVVVAVGVGALHLLERWRGRRVRVAVVGVLAFAWVAAYASVTANRASRGWAVAGYQLRAGRLAAAVEALRRTAPSDAVVGAPEFWAALHLHGGWLAVPSARFTPRAEDDATPVWGTAQEQLDLWWHAGVDHVLLEQGGQVHGAALDLLDARCPGAVRLLAEMPPQLLVRVAWDDACASSLGLTGR